MLGARVPSDRNLYDKEGDIHLVWLSHIIPFNSRLIVSILVHGVSFFHSSLPFVRVHSCSSNWNNAPVAGPLFHFASDLVARNLVQNLLIEGGLGGKCGASHHGCKLCSFSFVYRCSMSQVYSPVLGWFFWLHSNHLTSFLRTLLFLFYSVRHLDRACGSWNGVVHEREGSHQLHISFFVGIVTADGPPLDMHNNIFDF